MERKRISGVSDVLVFGRDMGLLETRRFVLERSHLQVSTTTDATEAKEMLISQQPALLIVCHTLTTDDSQAMLSLARQLRPDIRILILTVAHAAEEMGTVDAEFGVFQGPRAFLAKVNQLIAHRSNSTP